MAKPTGWLTSRPGDVHQPAFIHVFVVDDIETIRNIVQ
jgi:hypothetical protein